MRARSWLVLASLLPLAALAQKSEEEAGDTSETDKDAAGPLRERVPPVSGHQFLMRRRFEASPGVGLSIRDAFFLKVTPTLALTYHFTEAIALSLRGGYSISIVSGAAQICTTEDSAGVRGCSNPSFQLLSDNNAFGQLGLVAGLELQWSPIYGKLGLLAQQFLEFNMYGAIGPTFLMYGGKQTPTAGGNVGIGFRFFINNFLTVRLELRDLIYYEEFKVPKERSSVRNQLMAELGVSIFLPTTFDPL